MFRSDSYCYFQMSTSRPKRPPKLLNGDIQTPIREWTEIRKEEELREYIGNRIHNNSKFGKANKTLIKTILTSR